MNDAILIEDDDFLSLVAAAEAAAVSATAKRRKTTTTTTTASFPAKIQTDEGIYTAALRGSKSLLFQQQSTKLSDPIRPTNQAVAFSGGGGGGDGAGAGGAGNSCFKCGGLGHWARDCGGGGGTDPEVPEKLCGCGVGNCLVLTANTEKNRGRKFYRCPIREENGGCGFFEWCDNSSGTNNVSFGKQNYGSTPSFPDLPCPCGAGACLVLTAKTGKNIGQQFYRCPENQESSCGFFKWCNDNTTATVKGYNNTNDAGRNSYGVRSGSTCFKCGKEGHWAKDCPVTSSFSPTDTGAKSTSSSTCYKCGKPGHWSRDCSTQDVKAWPRR